jgi:predicted nucleotidyltransferase
MNDGLQAEHRRAIIGVLRAHPEIERAVLFGSRATGTFRPASDIDICLFGEALTLTDQARLAAQLEALSVPQRVDLVRHHAIRDEALLASIARDGRELFRRRAARAGGTNR